jgi:hypothetical protein
MRTLVVSDLHLGSRGGRDVLRQPPALRALVAAAAKADRLVLLGDLVELLEGRVSGALAEAMPVLERLGGAMTGGEILVVPGNHDHLLVRGWLRERRAAERPLGAATQVPADATEVLAEVVGALRPPDGRIRVQYPGAWLGRTIYAHHGHYIDQHLAAGPLARMSRAAAEEAAGPADGYELGRMASVAAASLVVRDLPDGFEEGVERIGGLARALGKALLAAGDAGRGRVERIAPLGSDLLHRRLEAGGLPAMVRVARDLGVLPRARHVVFGHVHRLGPLSAEEGLGAWHPEEDGPWLWNSGCWVHEPLIVGPAETTSPFWPGGAIWLDGERTPEVVRLLEDVPPGDVVAQSARSAAGGAAGTEEAAEDPDVYDADGEAELLDDEPGPA